MDEATLVNRALARIGAMQIQSLEVPGASGFIVPQTYAAVVDDLLGKYPWHFTRKKVALQILTAPPAIRWKNRFQLPSERLAPPRAFYDGADARRPFTAFEPEGDTVLADVDALWAEIQWRPPVTWWPSYFRELVELCTMAELAGAVREDWKLRSSLRAEAYGNEQYQGEGGQFAVATALDAQSAPSPEIDGGRNPLIDVRYGAGDARHGFEGW